MVTSASYFLDYLWLIPFFPLASAALMLLGGRLLPRKAIGFFCIGSVFLSTLCSAGALFALTTLDASRRVFQQVLFEWVTPGSIRAIGGAISFRADWGYLLDPLSSVMILIVSAAGLLIHIYAIGYMSRERSYYRLLGCMNLSLSSMLLLALANNLLLLFAGWEGVTVSAGLLSGFYFQNKSGSDGGRKSFMVNYVADGALLLGVLLIATTFGTVRFTSQGLSDPVAFAGIKETLGALLNQEFLYRGTPVFTVISLLLVAGAVGKSAQLPLSIWMCDGSERPTPLTAMMQAATVVTAGVYLIVRMNALFQAAPLAMDTVALLGAVNAIVAAVLATMETDIKLILTYSTISQLGYMFFALSAKAFSAGIFHLMTHAFSKSLLFLSAGAVIYAISGERDIRRMGGLWDTVPAASRTFVIATLAIAGIPPMAGFFSGGDILRQMMSPSTGAAHQLFIWTVALLTSGVTALYVFRVLFLVFFGLSRVLPSVTNQIREVPRTMTIPLVSLAFLSAASGWLALPSLWGAQNVFVKFLEPALSQVSGNSYHSSVPDWLMMAAPVVPASLGVWLAYALYLKRPHRQSRLAGSWPQIYDLFKRGCYVEEIYDAVAVRRLGDLAAAVKLIDAKVIDGFCVDGVAAVSRRISRMSIWWDEWIVGGLVNFAGRFARSVSHPIRMLQTGVFSSYVIVVLIGLIILLAYYGHHLQVLVQTLR